MWKPRLSIRSGLLTAFVLDSAHLGVVRVLPEVHRTGNVVIYPEERTSEDTIACSSLEISTVHISGE